MGMLKHFSSGSIPYAPNPDPYLFEVLKIKNVNNVSILLVKYNECTTFNGEKLLLLNKIYKESDQLDPHLLGNGHCVIARFEPNHTGWKLAISCAKK